jgi:hypothetical protein
MAEAAAMVTDSDLGRVAPEAEALGGARPLRGLYVEEAE